MKYRRKIDGLVADIHYLNNFKLFIYNENSFMQNFIFSWREMNDEWKRIK